MGKDVSKIMPLLGHIEEIRYRMITCCLTFLVFFSLCWWQNSIIWHWFTQPLHKILATNHRLIFTGPSEAFMTHIKVSALCALALSWPIYTWHVWRFISPGLVKSERRITACTLVTSTLLFVLGSLFAHIMVCPAAYQFFLSFEMPQASIPVMLEMRISEYTAFTVRIIIAFGLCGQLPLGMLLLTRWSVVSLERWKKLARPICAAIFTLAAVVTPPDILSMLALAVPMCLLYAGTLLLLMWLKK